MRTAKGLHKNIVRTGCFFALIYETKYLKEVRIINCFMLMPFSHFVDRLFVFFSFSRSFTSWALMFDSRLRIQTNQQQDLTSRRFEDGSKT